MAVRESHALARQPVEVRRRDLSPAGVVGADVPVAEVIGQDHQSCLHFAEKALAIKEKPMDYLCEDFAWGYLPWDLAAIAAYHEGNYNKAYKYGNTAHQLNPTEKRLENNLRYYSVGVSS